MGIYSEYLDRAFSFSDLTQERKLQLQRISEIRGARDILVYAADLTTGAAPISLDYSDILPVSDQLANLQGHAIDVVIETPGGAGEVAEDIVRLLRERYEDIAFIVPGSAKSAGTIMVMAGDEILMGQTSSLGPIDAQLNWQGKVFSAEALIEGIEKIKKEVEETGGLNRAYIPILQGISPGEIQSAQNALNFARELVRDWLVQYKFKNWNIHSTTGQPVTPEEKQARADEIAQQLCQHSRWLTHGRSIKIADLRSMRLLITDFTQNHDLADAIQRYHTLLQMTFQSTNIYKVIETPRSQIYRFMVPQGVQANQQVDPEEANTATIGIKCPRCGLEAQVQANLGSPQPLETGKHLFPSSDKFVCPTCGAEIDLSDARRRIEAQTKKKIVVAEEA